MAVLAIASTKGGVGKTTAAMALAARLARDGIHVEALDTDPNRALSGWLASVYEGPTVPFEARADDETVATEIAARAGVPLLLVDCAGFGTTTLSVALAAADAVIVPSLTSRADITEASRTVRLAESMARMVKRDPRVRVLLNRRKRSQVGQHAADELAEAGLPMLSASLSDTVGWQEMSHTGRLPTSAPAAPDLEALVAELRTLGWIPRHR